MMSRSLLRKITQSSSGQTIYSSHVSPFFYISNFPIDVKPQYFLAANTRGLSSLASKRFSIQTLNPDENFRFANSQKRMLSDNSKLKETLKKLNKEFEENKESPSQDGSSSNKDDVGGDGNAFGSIKDTGIKYFSIIKDNLQQAYAEMMGHNKESNLQRNLQQAESFKKPKNNSDDDAEEEPVAYTGPTAMVLVKEPQSQWDQMKNRLQSSKLIQDILKNSRKLGQQAASTDIGKKAVDVKNKVQDKIEDMREVWETSQNPIIYTLSGVWDNMTSETDEAMTITAIQKLDPKFVKEHWLEEVRLELVPNVIKAHLEGDTRTLKKWVSSEATYKTLAADIRARKQDGYTIDSNILNIDENVIILKLLDDGTPIIVGVYGVQQINCVRNRQGDIVEGGESEIRMKFYQMAFSQIYDEETATVRWMICDYGFSGDVPYV